MIIPVLAANPSAMTGRGNWTYLVTGEVPVLIDAGIGAPEHIGAIMEHVPGGPAHVIVTHAHEDHIGGAMMLAECWPAAQFWKFPWPACDVKYPVGWKALADTQMFPAGDDWLEVVHTPGHAPDHVCLWHAASQTLFCGDLMMVGSTVVIPASAGGRLVDYMASLRRIETLGPARILPAHGDPIDEPLTLIREYVDHRRMRERQVLAALSAGDRTVAAVAERIYVGLDPALGGMARESVLAHLVKLEDEGVVGRDGDEWITLTT